MEIPARAIATIVLGSAILGGAIQSYISKQGRDEQSQSKISETKKDVVTVIKEKRGKDGSLEKETTITDKSIRERSEQSSSSKSTSPDWIISAGAYSGLSLTPSYVLEVDRRILGPIFIGVFGTTNQEAGVKLSLEL